MPRVDEIEFAGLWVCKYSMARSALEFFGSRQRNEINWFAEAVFSTDRRRCVMLPAHQWP